MYREKTKFVGVYTRKLLNGDISFDIKYDHEGKTHWEAVGKKSEGYSIVLAQQIRQERIRNARHGELLPDKKLAPFFKDVAEKYLAWSEQNKKSYVDDECRYRLHLKSALDKLRLNEITPVQVEKIRTDLTKDKKSPGTVKQVLSLLRQIFNFSKRMDLYNGENPVSKIKMPKLNNRRERYLTHQEANLLLPKLKEKSEQVHNMAVIGLHCGLRLGEICNLQLQHVDFKKKELRLVDTKNKETRYVPMTKRVSELLSSYSELEHDDYFFKRRNEKSITDLSKTFQRVADKLFNENVSDNRMRVCFHTLRHTFASWLVMQGENLITIMNLLGHKSLAMVQRYAHLSATHKKEAVLKLESSFNGSSQK